MVSERFLQAINLYKTRIVQQRRIETYQNLEDSNPPGSPASLFLYYPPPTNSRHLWEGTWKIMFLL